MAMTRRMDRVNVLLQREISRVLASELKDPRLPTIVSVTRVDTSRDLSTARVYVSVLGDQEDKSNAMRALKSAAGFIRKNMRSSLELRNLPAVEFRLDETIELGAEVSKIISQVASEQQAGEDSAPPKV